MKRILTISISVLIVTALFGGCTPRSQHYAVSVVDYLYPGKETAVTPSVPVLSLPVRVGIAFVPGDERDRYGVGRMASGYALTETLKLGLMQAVADHFKKYPFVKDIEIIPSPYLTPRGSFANLDQIRSMYGVDVIALLSYDQVQFTDEGALSLTYWTLIGAYVVMAEKNDTHTMLDAVVFDIPSRKMLFRAPGTSIVKGQATPINLSQRLRADGEAGFNEASKQMIVNLDQQLALFKDKVKERPAEYKVIQTRGYTGGGSIDAWHAASLAALAGGFLWLRRRG